MAKIAILLGGGDGTRAGGPLPKQFQEISGMTVLQRSVEAFLYADPETRVFVVLHPSFLEEWEDVVETIERKYNSPITLVCGGKSRWHSVKNALTMIAEYGVEADDIIAVHDGARPLVSDDVINAGWSAAEQNGAAIPVIPVTDSLRHLNGEESQAVIRREYVAVQTPQVFRAETILAAYEREYSDIFTDDASVVEANGGKIALFAGAPENIKITNPLDFKIAEAILSAKA
jgi:2-C-methyl-D-erythritol 4-phosphate cytidylyltransferase